VSSSCGQCAPGQYACPFGNTCVATVEEYVSCPGLRGTHLDWNLSEDERISLLLSKLNLTDMTGQLVNNAPAISHVAIPAYNWLNDDEHGVIGTTRAASYPMGVGIGASWSKEIAHSVGRAIGIEARSTHNTLADKSGNNCSSTSTGKVTANGCGITLYAPNINLVRDPRWGRAEEVYGEDPYLTAELTVGMVTGMQGNKEGETLAEDGGALMSGACCKHYAVYNNENVPIDRFTLDANVSNRDLWETYLPVMKACVVRAKATHVMCSYNAVNGKPTCAHDELLNQVLRDQWKFEGFVVSDYDAWINLFTTHHYASSYGDAAAKGINAGLDQEGGFGTYSAVDALPAAVASGNVSMTTVSKAVERLMRIRIRLGMLDPPARVSPMNSTYRPDKQAETPDKLALSQRAARESIVLFKNSENALPLDRSKLESLVVIGPQADDPKILLGAANYAPADLPSLGVSTILGGLKESAGRHTAVTNVSGCVDVPCATADTGAVSSALSNASAAVIVLGDSFGDASLGWPLCQGTGEDGCESEMHDRTTIELPGKQVDVVKAAKAALGGRPLVCVLVHGGAIALGDAKGVCDAIVDLWVPGQRGGAALAEIIFGDFSPAGRSPVTFYTSTSDLPDMGDFNEYPHENSNGSTYRYYTGLAPAFRFGDGLSYTQFKYTNLEAPQTSPACADVTVSVTVNNIGDHVSDEVVQVYAQVPEATVPAPRIRLVAFERLTAIPAHSSQKATLTIKPESFAVVHPSTSPYVPQLAVEKGTLVLHVGGSQPGPDTLRTEINISETVGLETCNIA